MEKLQVEGLLEKCPHIIARRISLEVPHNAFLPSSATFAASEVAQPGSGEHQRSRNLAAESIRGRATWQRRATEVAQPGNACGMPIIWASEAALLGRGRGATP
jgi:hypothetical protein